MEKRFIEDDILEGVDKKRRDFIKKVAIGTAFAVPVINSFSMDGLKVRLGPGQAGADEKGGFDASSPGMVAVPVDKRPPPASPSR